MATPLLPKFPFSSLPGDITITRPGFRLYFPLATSLLLSAVVSLVLWLLRRWAKRPTLSSSAPI